jgi:NAD(P)-dependent dehydrogenase (short-subunit alcohol dehydrogenase family)
MTDLAHASVVNGASSGIGRATALAFAARRGEVLEEVAAECRARGGETVVVPTGRDRREGGPGARAGRRGGLGRHRRVGQQRRARRRGRLGRRAARAPPPRGRGGPPGRAPRAHAALPVFLRRGLGVLVNNVSMGAWTPMPFASAYTASKFGLRGLTASLRQELVAHPRIHACAVFPAAIDTPRILMAPTCRASAWTPAASSTPPSGWPRHRGRRAPAARGGRRGLSGGLGRASPTGSRRCPSRPPWAPWRAAPWTAPCPSRSARAP